MNPRLCGCEIESMHSTCVRVSRFFFITVSAQNCPKTNVDYCVCTCKDAHTYTLTSAHVHRFEHTNSPQRSIKSILWLLWKKINKSCYTNGEELTSEKEQDGSWSRYCREIGKIWSEHFSSSLTFHLVSFAIVFVSTGVTWLDIYSRLCVMRGRGFTAGVWGFDWML